MADDDLKHMQMAIDLAAKCVAEDDQARPKVGAVLVSGGIVLGKGFRGENGKGDHAEYTVLEKKVRAEIVSGATVYTTLEPCITRNDPDKIPCAQRLYGRRIARVVIGMLDPNQLICGRGVRRLRQAGIAVEFFPPHLMAQIEDQNRDFIDHHERATATVSDDLALGAGLNLINPHYDSDVKLLDEPFHRKDIISNETVAIVTGDALMPELLDRPVAGLLRDEIDLRGQSRAFRRALIVSNTTWEAETALQACATVAVGAAIVNPLTKRSLEEAGSQNRKPWDKGGLCGVFVSGPRVALWGGTAEQTRASVQNYIRDKDGLVKLLQMIWK
jgi:pyrimidine deaminase RibD-like protein